MHKAFASTPHRATKSTGTSPSPKRSLSSIACRFTRQVMARRTRASLKKSLRAFHPM